MIESTSKGSPAAARAAAYATVFASSAAIMALELTAGRLIARYLGQSLYTWTAIIGVILAGISLGNYAGGRWADRSCSRRTCSVQFLLAAGACLSALATNAWAGQWSVLEACAWPVRIALHVTLVFFVPAAVLGTISPVIARRALAQGAATGATIGKVYAWATAGSILGTVLTGFWLVVLMGASKIVVSVSTVLAAIGLVYCVASFWSKSERTVQDVSAEPASAERGTTAFMRRMILAVFLANACVMMIEIDAGRILSRQFGQSLYTWTTVIGVTLAGMSLGSYLGGVLAERMRPERLLASLLILASWTSLCVPALNAFAAKLAVLETFSWPAHIFLHAAMLFALPSVLLGAVTPVVAKMILRDPRAHGKAVGLLYAWGSVGSIAGTFLAGFVLIAALGTVRLMVALGAILAVTALCAAWTRKAAWVWAAICGVALLMSVAPWHQTATVGEALCFREPSDPTVIYRDESQYSYVAVLAEPERPQLREMILDQLTHSQIDLDAPLSLKYEYEWIYAAVTDRVFPSSDTVPRSFMLIGGGGFVYPHYLETTRPGSYVEVSEIDPAVTEAAHAAFGLPRDAAMTIFNMDARNRIEDLIRAKRAGGKVPSFDAIYGDSFNDYTVPYHLTTRECVADVYELLNDGGLYFLNMIDIFDSGEFVGAAIATCRSVFPYVYVFNTGRPPMVRDTFVMVSSKKPLDLVGIPAVLRTTYGYMGRLLDADAMASIEKRAGDLILTDDYAPVENLLAPVARSRRKDLGEIYLAESRQALAESDLDRALANCRIALKVHERWPEARDVLAGILAAKGDEDGALAEWRRALEDDPRDKEAWLNVGRTLAKRGQTQDAAEALRNASNVDSQTAAFAQSLGVAWMQLNDARAAADAFRKAVELDPALASAHYNLGLALAQLGSLSEAIQAWRTALAANPDYDDARYNLIVAFDQLKRFDEAWEEVRQWQSRGKQVDQALLDSLARDSGRSQ